MGQDVPQENLSRVVVDFGDEPESIPFDVEDGKFADGIRRWEHLPDFHQTSPPRFPGDAIPDIQRPTEAGMFVGRFQQLLPADNVQDWPRNH
jgi:hypothetical protein